LLSEEKSYNEEPIPSPEKEKSIEKEFEQTSPVKVLDKISEFEIKSPEDNKTP
jgi:hypothetical protein